MSKKPYLVLFWEGPKPVHIKLCEETVKRHCSDAFNLHVLNFANIYKLADRNDKNLKKIIESPRIRIEHKSDFIRTVVLYKRGGFYMDSDVIVLKEFSNFTKYLKTRDFAGTTCLFGCTKYSSTIKQWNKDLTRLLLDSNSPGFDESRYLDTNKVLYNQKNYKFFAGITREMIRPISFRPSGVKKFFDKKILVDDVISDKTHTVTIWNSLLPEWFKKLSRKQILESDYLISKLFRRGLGIEE